VINVHKEDRMKTKQGPGVARSGSVRSADGTTVGYRRWGDGPAVIVIPGALSLASDFDGFARALGGFEVHVLDRRGRGASGPQGHGYSIGKECDDVLAVQEATGATLLFGHSFGGLVALETAMRAPSLRALALYEPGVSINGSVSLDWVQRCQDELGRGDGFGAFLTFVRGINPETSGKAPRWLLRLILPRAMGKSELAQKIALLPTTIPEHQEAGRLDNRYGEYAAISADVLLLAGKDIKRTGAGRAGGVLQRELPHASLHEFPSLGHFGSEDKPDVVAPVVSSFFATHLP
jgi:pimeloyl-ACP methyl ester carboxylesterase